MKLLIKRKKVKKITLKSFGEYNNKYKKFKYNPKKITVIISNKTASAGELVAISLMYKNNVKINGETSNGQLTETYNGILSNGDFVMFTNKLIQKNNKIITKIVL